MSMSGQHKGQCEPLTETEFSKVFASFQQASDQYEKMKILVEPVIREFQGKSIKFMSIGAGNGCFEDSLVKEQGLLLDYFHGIEPDANRRAALQEVVKNWNTRCFIDERCFHHDFTTAEKFDLVQMVHMLYHFSDPVPVILRAKSFLKPNGKLVIIHQTNAGIPKIHDRFSELFNYTSPPFSNETLTSEGICNDLDKIAVDYRYTKIPAQLDVTEFIKKQGAPTANHIATFMLHSVYENLPKDFQEEIHEMINERCIEDSIGRFLFQQPVGMLEITG